MNNGKNAPACPVKKTSIGGQALIEGIMMRGPKMTAMAVRDPEGNIVLEKWENPASKRPAFCRWPFIRGVFGFIDSMKIGYKCLMRSAEIATEEENGTGKTDGEKVDTKKEDTEKSETEKAEAEAETAAVKADEKGTTPDQKKTAESPAPDKKEQKEQNGWLFNVLMVLSGALGVVLALGLFVYLPAQLYSWLALAIPSIKDNYTLRAVFEGVLKIAIFVGYMAAITLMKDIRRTFMYHGAEHKTIFCYEKGLPLTVENVKVQRRFHPRCGTSFLILMLIVSIFISMFVRISHPLLRTLVKLLLIPVLMGIGYELIKLAGRKDNWLTRIISAPGTWLQHISTKEPDDSMIECAIKAFLEVIPEDESDKW